MTREEFLDRIDDIMCGTSIAERAYLEGVYYEVTKPHWISVEDELPKENGRYLFYHDKIGVQLAYYYNDLSLDKAVTHWMPLPAPPEKGGEQ